MRAGRERACTLGWSDFNRKGMGEVEGVGVTLEGYGDDTQGNGDNRRDQSLPILNHVTTTNDPIGYYHLPDMRMRMCEPPL